MEGATLVEQSKVETEQVQPPTALAPSPPKASPWGNVPITIPVALTEVMDETLAGELQKKEDGVYPNSAEDDSDVTKYMTEQTTDTSNDLLLAHMLQHEYDREFDDDLQRIEKHQNANSKVKVSFNNYRAVHPALWGDEDSDELEDQEEPKIKKDTTPSFKKKSGTSGKGAKMISKHDATVCGRKNATKIMEFPPEFETGDGDGFDMKLSNKVYNKLKKHSETESKRATRTQDKKDHSTAVQAMDAKTRLEMYKLVNNGTLDGVYGVISAGKESVVFHAAGGSQSINDDSQPQRLIPEEIAIKVFKTVLTDFKNRADYVKGDVRFFKDEFKKKNPRKIMKLWAEKEEINLKRLRKYNIPVPEVVCLKKHLLVMSYIGKDGTPAPKLKDVRMGYADWQIAYDQVFENMKTMYRDAQLVHGDLSEYNLLWHDNQVYIIDVSQSVDAFHPHAHEFLLRDCKNMSEFFTKKGVADVPSPQGLFNQVTGLNLKGEGQQEFLMEIEEYEKNEEKLRTGESIKEYPFDFFYDKATRERLAANESEIAKSRSLSESSSDDSDPNDGGAQPADDKSLFIDVAGVRIKSDAAAKDNANPKTDCSIDSAPDKVAKENIDASVVSRSNIQ